MQVLTSSTLLNVLIKCDYDSKIWRPVYWQWPVTWGESCGTSRFSTFLFYTKSIFILDYLIGFCSLTLNLRQIFTKETPDPSFVSSFVPLFFFFLKKDTVSTPKNEQGPRDPSVTTITDKKDDTNVVVGYGSGNGENQDTHRLLLSPVTVVPTVDDFVSWQESSWSITPSWWTLIVLPLFIPEF